jgi:hypothetical protein
VSLIALTTPELLTLISVLLGGGFIAAMVGVYKARPERDSVIVSSAQNAAEILQGLNKALYEELTRERARTQRLNRAVDAACALLKEHGIAFDPDDIQ